MKKLILKSMPKKLTIIIENLSEGSKKGYAATVKELGDSVIMADSLKEIFELLPDLIKTAQKNNIGIFKKETFKIKIIQRKLAKV